MAELWDDPAFVAAVAESHGRHLASSPLMNVAALGEPDAALVLTTPGADGIVRGLSPRGALVAVADGRALRLDRAGLAVRPAPGLDPALALARVTGPLAGEPLDLDGDQILARAARFLASELAGVAAGALDLAGEHVRSRRQFGVPIGSFQAVRHRLAEAHVQLTAARELLAALPGADLDTHLLVLKPAAGGAARAAVAAAQQVCGGMGFTEEFGLHRYVRRALVLDSLLVGSEDADEMLGRLAIRGRVLPDRQVVLS